MPDLHAKQIIVDCQPSISKVDTEVVFIPQGQTQSPYVEIIKKLESSKAFDGKDKTSQWIRFGAKGPGENLLLVGLGKPGDITAEKLRVAGAGIYARLTGEKVPSAAIGLDSLAKALGGKAKLRDLFVGLLEGILIRAYTFDKYKKLSDEDNGAYKGLKLHFVASDTKVRDVATDAIAAVKAEVEAINWARDFSNEPSNIGTPEYFTREVSRVAKRFGLRCKVLGEAEAKREGMGLFLGVGQGSKREGKIVVLEYVPPKKTKAKTIALVGKGITFDSGGISIKPSAKMEEMKHDMTGASTVFAATLLASVWKVPNRLISILAFTENMPGGNAIQPGNILKSRSGKSVEVVNTDAEGRLILADALDYIQDYKPDVVVDVATLTGAVGVALGPFACGLLGNDQGLIEKIKRAADTHGEKVWQLPLFDEYFEDMKSEVADMKNVANTGTGGTSRGAIFLKQFIRTGVKWAHLDIASTAWGVAHIPYIPKKGASGLHVRTLAQLVKDL